MDRGKMEMDGQGGRGTKPWTYFLYLIFPVPLVFLVLLSVPFPKRIRRHIHSLLIKTVDFISFMKIEVGGASVTLVAIIIFVALLGFAFSISETQSYITQESNAVVWMDRKVAIRCVATNASAYDHSCFIQRNFWISLLGLVLWLILSRVRSLLKEIEELHHGAEVKAKDEIITGLKMTLEAMKADKAILEKTLKEVSKKAPADKKKD